MTPENIPRIVIGLDKAISNDYGAEVRGYWLNGCLRITHIKTQKSPDTVSDAGLS